MTTTEAASSPATSGFSTVHEELNYYKSQYEQLELDLQDFKASSKEIEAELEKDIEASEKRERTLKEKQESLKYEVDEWQSKYRQAKTEANTAQNSLQKEITGLRETSRSLQLKLRDIEVANDDFERQARNTTSSLEDIESKYNVALERGVMLEEEIKRGEQEREQLRIDAQRLRDELSDLKVEAEITQEKLRAAEMGTGRIKRVSQLSDAKEMGLRSPGSDSASMPSTFTPPVADTESSVASSIATTPPSPPLSDASGQRKATDADAEVALDYSKADRSSRDPNATPRPSLLQRPRHSRGPSTAGQAPPFTRGLAPVRPRPSGVTVAELPRSGSLYQIRGLIGKMQKLEERVQSARSKLPAPTSTPPRASPRGTALGGGIPSSVTVRSNRKSSRLPVEQSTPTPSMKPSEDGGSRRQSRVSFGYPDAGRPSSRTSNVSYGAGQFARPSSRMAQERQEPYKRPASSAEVHHRPRSSLGGRYTSTLGTAAVDEQNVNRYGTPLTRKPGDKYGGTTGLVTPGTLTRRQSAQTLSSSTSATTASRKSNLKRLPDPSRQSINRVTQVKDKEPDQSSSTQSATDIGETY